MPPILSMAIPAHHGEVDVKTAFVPGLDSFAIKVSPGFFDNPKRGLPSLNGLMMLFDGDRPGEGRAPRQRLPDRRADRRGGRGRGEALAPEAVRTAGVIGAGVQAELQIRALKLVRDFSELLVWARDPARPRPTREDAAGARNTRAGGTNGGGGGAGGRHRRHDDACARAADPRRLAAPGLHITAMGSDAPDKSELDPAIVRARPLRLRQEQPVDPARRDARRRGGRADRGRPPGGRARRDLRRPETGAHRRDDVTICDLTGTGVQDTAIATHAFRVARERGLGTVIES